MVVAEPDAAIEALRITWPMSTSLVKRRAIAPVGWVDALRDKI